MKIALASVILLTLITVTGVNILTEANAYSTMVSFNNFRWEKEWLNVLIVGGDERQKQVVEYAVFDFVYQTQNYTKNFDKWNVEIKKVGIDFYNEWSWYLKPDVTIIISDDYWMNGDFGTTFPYDVKGNNLFYCDSNCGNVDHVNISLTTKANSTSYLPEFMLYNVAMHEFGHAVGLGHTNYDTRTEGIDVMSIGVFMIKHIEVTWYYNDETERIDRQEITNIIYNEEVNRLSELDLKALIILYGLDGWSYRGERYPIPLYFGMSK